MGAIRRRTKFMPLCLGNIFPDFFLEVTPFPQKQAPIRAQQMGASHVFPLRLLWLSEERLQVVGKWWWCPGADVIVVGFMTEAWLDLIIANEICLLAAGEKCVCVVVGRFLPLPFWPFFLRAIIGGGGSLHSRTTATTLSRKDFSDQNSCWWQLGWAGSESAYTRVFFFRRLR